MSANSIEAERPVPRFRLALLSLALVLCGCTTIDSSLSGSELNQIRPFAQKTVDVMVVEDIRVRDDELIHLRPYVDDSFVELDALQRRMRHIRQYRQKLVEYSIELVRINEEYDKAPAKIEAYADHLESMVGLPELEQIGISEEEWNAILAEVRSQSNFLDALRSFQPVITAATLDFTTVINSIESDLLPAARQEFDRRIESNFREVNQLRLILHEIRKELLAGMIAVETYHDGDAAAIAEFRQESSRLNGVFMSDTPTEAQLDEIRGRLREQIGDSTRLIAEMDADFAIYEKTRVELDQKEAEILKALTVARLQIDTWTRAHNALSQGAKMSGEIMQLTVKAAKHYLIP